MTATHPLSKVMLLMMFSSSQTITGDTRTDDGNMSSFSCQDGLQAVDVQTPSTVSRMDDQMSVAELWESAMRAGQPSQRHKFGAMVINT